MCWVLWDLCLLVNAHAYICICARILYIHNGFILYLYRLINTPPHMNRCVYICTYYTDVCVFAEAFGYHSIMLYYWLTTFEEYFSTVKWASLIPSLGFQKPQSLCTCMCLLGHFGVLSAVFSWCCWQHQHMSVQHQCSRFLQILCAALPLEAVLTLPLEV